MLIAAEATRAESPPAGSGVLHLARVGSRTVLRRAFAASPLKILNPRVGGPAAWVYTATHGGGFVGGDTICLTVDVGPDARGVLTTQSSTKVYRSAVSATQRLDVRVADDGLLVVAPDPTVCFAGSSFAQHQVYDLAEGASLVVVDWMTCGRRARGERWAFDRYTGHLEVRRAGRRWLYDRLRLVRDEGPLAERMGRFNVWGTLVLAGPLVRAAAEAAVGDVSAQPVALRAGLIVSAAPLGDDGAIVRLAGVSVEEIGAVLRSLLGGLRTHLGAAPWDRKW